MSILTIPRGNSASVDMRMIAEGNYSAEYMKRTSTQEYRMQIRHTKEKGVGTKVGLDRHNVELKVRTFPTALLPAGREQTVYFVVRSDANTDGTEAAQLLMDLATFIVNRGNPSVALRLVNWESDLGASAGSTPVEDEEPIPVPPGEGGTPF